VESVPVGITGVVYHLTVWRRDDLTLSKYEEFSLSLGKQLTTRTLEGYIASLKRFREISGDKDLGEYTPADVERFRSTLSLQGLQNSTVNIFLRSLKALFNRAVVLQLLTSNIFSRVKLNKVPRTAPCFLTPEDLNKLLVHVRKKALKDIYIFLWHTGLRITELINLRWSDVDMKRGWMIIMFSKSGRSRGIPLNAKALGILQKFPVGARTGHIFKNRNGEPLKRTAISHSFKKAVRRAGLPEGLHLHSIRHSTASVGIMRGMDITTVSKLLGHSSILITSSVYGHISDAHMSEEIKLLE
jgi:site-specific recombinase XerD